MTPRAVARRYAAALFDVVHKHGDIDRADQELGAIKLAIAGHDQLRKVLEAPGVPMPVKRRILDDVVTGAGDVSQEIRRLLGLLAERDRLAMVPDVADAFAERVMQAKKIVPAEVVTAVPLPDDSRAALAAALGRAAGAHVTITERVDPSIVGGVIARVGSVVFDGSVTTQIARLRQKLVADA
ncbi:MAG TPA: ATP synthase F1 subunit delta [Vicinamibacterales bacterium]|nr:ATP synthase F1 subunit delta [Vicinamibacterales bacterium]